MGQRCVLLLRLLCVCVCLRQCGFGSPEAIIFGESQEVCGCGGENSCTVRHEHNEVIFGMVLGNRWKGNLSGGLTEHTCTPAHKAPGGGVKHRICGDFRTASPYFWESL